MLDGNDIYPTTVNQAYNILQYCHFKTTNDHAVSESVVLTTNGRKDNNKEGEGTKKPVKRYQRMAYCS